MQEFIHCSYMKAYRESIIVDRLFDPFYDYLQTRGSGDPHVIQLPLHLTNCTRTTACQRTEVVAGRALDAPEGPNSGPHHHCASGDKEWHTATLSCPGGHVTYSARQAEISKDT